MIKRPVCRKLPGDLSIFLNQPQMVHSFGYNTRKLCYKAIFLQRSLSLAPSRKLLSQEVFSFWFGGLVLPFKKPNKRSPSLRGLLEMEFISETVLSSLLPRRPLSHPPQQEKLLASFPQTSWKPGLLTLGTLRPGGMRGRPWFEPAPANWVVTFMVFVELFAEEHSGSGLSVPRCAPATRKMGH